MLAGERAAEFQHQVRYFLRDGFEFADALLGLEINHRPHMQASDRSVGINPGGGFVAPHNVQKPGDEIAQLFRRHRRVLDKRDRLGVSFHGRRQAQRRFAQAPDFRLRRQVRLRAVGIAEMARAQVLLERAQARR